MSADRIEIPVAHGDRTVHVDVDRDGGMLPPIMLSLFVSGAHAFCHMSFAEARELRDALDTLIAQPLKVAA